MRSQLIFCTLLTTTSISFTVFTPAAMADTITASLFSPLAPMASHQLS